MKQSKSKSLIIRIKNSQKKIAINNRDIAYLAKRILKIKGVNAAELSILFVGIERIRRLNRRFKNKDLPTDVLAFSMREGKYSRLHSEILGDVVICPQTAQKQAKIFNTDINYELNLYLIHGILHLLGYKDTNKIERSLISKEETRILKRLSKNEKTEHHSKL